MIGSVLGYTWTKVPYANVTSYNESETEVSGSTVVTAIEISTSTVHRVNKRSLESPKNVSASNLSEDELGEEIQTRVDSIKKKENGLVNSFINGLSRLAKPFSFDSSTELPKALPAVAPPMLGYPGVPPPVVPQIIPGGQAFNHDAILRGMDANRRLLEEK